MTQPTNSYNLNQDQQGAADAFMEFLFSDDKEFIISGPAGVGKTYMMEYITDRTLPQYNQMCQMLGIEPTFNEVAMTATTNKAADVLSQSIKRPVSTVHSFFNLTVRDDYSSGKTTIKRTNKWKVHEKKIIFIDEASMIDTNLWRMIHEGTANCKIVYVGDRNQLAPVQEDLSPIYKHDSPLIELTQQVRNSGQPALMNVCQQLRETVSTGVFHPIKLVPGVIDLLDAQQMQDEILQKFQQQTHESRILAFTNKQVMAYNAHIRGIRALPDEFQVGEFLVNNSVYHGKKEITPVEMGLEVLKNHGASTYPIDEKNDVHLDVNLLDMKTSSGDLLFNVPVPTNRQHFNDLSKYYSKQKDWLKFFYLKNNMADLRPRDAATVHKSQGSTYDSVFVDLGNISTCHIANQAARMLYVAFSRARTRVFLYGTLADKYGGILA